MSERYAAAAARPDYSHRYHVGNVGDVWKHLIWRALIEALQLSPRPLDIIDCHAGHGEYHLASTGEWTAGIGRLLNQSTVQLPLGVESYLMRIRSFGLGVTRLERYPGSPILLSELLRAEDSLCCYEIEPEAFATLEALAGRYRFQPRHADGLGALRNVGTEDRSRLCLIDPPWNLKADWQTIPRLVVDTARDEQNLCIAIWYPIKSYTRVNAMLEMLRKTGQSCLIADLITTPLELRLNKLNGSGVCIINPPAGLAETLGAIGPAIGAACATHGGAFEVRIRFSSALPRTDQIAKTP